MWDFKQLFGENWKTTFFGLMAGVMIVIQDFLEKGESDAYKISLGVAVFLIGRFASDIKKP